jgi:phosphotransferase system enzyme I (PtsI)
MKLHGIGASKGIAIGPVFKFSREKIKIDSSKIEDTEKEIEKFEDAVEQSIIEIKKIRDKTVENIDENHGAIFDAHMEILKDPELHRETKDLIINEKLNCAKAFKNTVDKFVMLFNEMDVEYMKERANDIIDVSNRVLYHMLNIDIKDLSKIKKDSIIVANDLTPSDTASLNTDYVIGFATLKGGNTSHSAIMARTLEIPAVVGIENLLESCRDGDRIIIDGIDGEVIIEPSDEEVKFYEKKAEDYKNELSDLKKYKNKPSTTKDGRTVEISGNIASHEDVENLLEKGGDGVGLYRTEYLFIGKKYCPTEEEQYNSYKKVLEMMGDKPVIIRTLDIGGDKDVEYMDTKKELNPFLGHRAIRLCLENQDIFKEQVRALLRASIYGNLKIMFPMIATIEEFREAKSMVLKEKEELLKEGYEIKHIDIGIMVEVPSAALIADKFAKEVDFFSIGTNDLIQYTFAADRMNERVSYLYQPYHPSLLRLIKMVIDASHKEGKWTGMCGELAGNEKALPLMLGLGLDEFSMNSSNILKIRKLICSFDYSKAKKVADKALKMTSSKEVENLLEKEINKIQK